MENRLKKVAVFTSGGDAPGMNACIRAVVRTCSYYGINIFGIRQGYKGMINNDLFSMDARAVGNIIHRGGTILKSARSEEFRTSEGRETAWKNLKAWDIDALVGIGGDGSFRGLHKLHEEFGIRVIGIPATIDNDLYGSDYTIGYDTATNTAIEAIDKIRDTASSHNRLFFIEVMGREAGFIAVRSGLAAGAEAMLIPEREMALEELVEVLERGARKNKSFSLVIVAEGNKQGGVLKIAEEVRKKLNFYDSKVTILGHLQRGGSPSCTDRVLSSRLGVAAIEGLLDGQDDVMVGLVNDLIRFTPLEEATTKGREINQELLRIAKILSI